MGYQSDFNGRIPTFVSCMEKKRLHSQGYYGKKGSRKLSDESFDMQHPLKPIKRLLHTPSESLHDTVLIDLLAILQKSLDRALFVYTSFDRLASQSSITIVHIRKFYRM